MSVRLKLSDLRRRGMVSSIAVAAGAMGFLVAPASAQGGTGVPEGYSAASGLADVRSYSLESDGSVRLVMNDGSTLVVPADQVSVIEGVIYVDTAALSPAAPVAEAAAASGSGGGGGAILGVLGGAGALGAAAGGGGGGGGSSSSGGGGGGGGSSNTAPSFTSGTTANFAENGTGTAYQATANDADGDALTYSISGGADSSLFRINASTGAVTFAASPDFENPGDANGDNVYEVTISVSDGTTSVQQAVSITVTDVSTPPTITSANSATVAENETDVVYQATATDSAGETLSFAIAGGADAALFQIDSATGEVRFIAPPDFDAAGDANGDNVYEITVAVSDGEDTVTQNVSITVTNIDEAPLISTGIAFTVQENSSGAVFTAAATDPEGNPVTFSLEGADAALFSLDAGTGEVSFTASPDFEAPADSDGDNTYEVTLVASDGSQTTRQGITVDVTNVAEGSATSITSSTTSTVSENQTSAYVIRATGEDGAVLTYSISGTDAALFNVNAETGEVSFIAAPDFEAPGDANNDGVYDITVTAANGADSDSQNVSITVGNASESGDLPSDNTTDIVMVSGGSYTGQLEVEADTDWIAVHLEAGQRYEINLFGSGANEVVDPLMRLYDSSGSLVAENDDISLGSVRDSQISFTVQTSGIYYIEADTWDDEGSDPSYQRSGQYTVTVEHTDPLSVWSTQEIADYLNQNGWNGAQWNVSSGDTLTVNITGLTADGQALARAALQSWTDVTGIVFQEVATGGDIVFDDEEEGAFAGPTSITGGFFNGATVNVGTEWLDTYGAGINSYSYQTYIHEIGHALGLGHAGPYDGSADYATDAIYLNDSWQVTIMSYFTQTENTFIDATFAFVLTPQLADIVAVQDMYGAPGSVRGGDTTYGFNSNAGNVVFDATSFTTITSYTILDTGGHDTLDYSGSAAQQVLDLRQDSYSSVQGGIGNVAIAIGTVIEDAIGGTGNDTFYANGADNTLTGNSGDDVFVAGAGGGNDVFDGGTGNDTAVFSGASSDYSITTNGSGNTVVTDLRAGSPDGTVELIGVENIAYGGAIPETASVNLLDDSQVARIHIDVEDFGAHGCACHVCTSTKEDAHNHAGMPEMPGVSEVQIDDAMGLDLRMPLPELHIEEAVGFMTSLTDEAVQAVLEDWQGELVATVSGLEEVPLPAFVGDVVQPVNTVSALPKPAELPLPGFDDMSPAIDPSDTAEGWV